MHPIRLPRAAAKMKTFVEVVTATHDRAFEIRQDEHGATVTASDGHQLCRIVAPPPAGAVPGKVSPFLVDGRVFSKAAAEVGCSRTEAIVSATPDHVAAEDRPLVVVKLDEKSVGVAGPEGTPQTIPVVSGAMPDCARIVAAVHREAAEGGTKAVARIDPRFLQNVADTAVAMGLGTVEITFSPKLNFIAAEGKGPDGCTVQFAIAGIGEVDFDEIATRERPAWEVHDHGDDPLVFTMPEPKTASRTKRRPKASQLFPDDEIPF